MSSQHQSRRKQIVLTVFNNEPLAHLAQQRLQQAGIPCLIRSRYGGPGLWGSAYNLPHALYVYDSDEAQARETLALPGTGQASEWETESRTDSAGPEPDSGSPRSSLGLRGIALWLLVILFAIVLGWGLFYAVFANL